MEAHGEDLQSEVENSTLVEALKADYTKADLNPADRAMLDFSVKLTRHPDRMNDRDVERLRAHGFADEEILEIVHIIGYFNYINRVADALGVDPEPEWPS
ncbi:MAG: peroxidase-related enzyme [Acidobacteriota bacterium]